MCVLSTFRARTRAHVRVIAERRRLFFCSFVTVLQNGVKICRRDLCIRSLDVSRSGWNGLASYKGCKKDLDM